jgi:hypothetical protein
MINENTDQSNDGISCGTVSLNSLLFFFFFFFFFTVEHVKKKKKRRRPLTATVPQIWWNLRNFNRFSPIIF